MSDKKTRERKIVPEHMREAQAMTKIGKILDGIGTQESRCRISDWIKQHYGDKL